ncbi:hypothetical protein NKR23_g65 [Pleurostoma richardsiae]|uniref:Yeast cell wall synthesis Kre9/Knh1-like N-terminal domain-containing protein n=1 Tax=Pleurostoma richardsiae TaxID=41990 RepID=A0AA38VL63_9PEZI|nr:hypothetical protein NKR23_g65 [Pleurostoma richardsiae]
MRFTVSAAALLAFAGAAFAQTDGFDPITKPLKDESIPAGSTYEVTWEASADYNGTVTLILLAGSSASTLQLGDSIATGIDNSAGKYSWAVASSLGDAATYGLKLQLDDDTSIFQYSFPFHIAASASASGSSSASASASGSSSGSATKTVTLSSVSASSSSSSSASESTAAATTTSTSAESVSTPAGNLSTTAAPLTVTSVVVPTQTGSSASSTSSSPATVSDSAAAHKAAGSLALIGGIAAAILAL